MGRIVLSCRSRDVKDVLLGFDIGGTKCAVLLGERDGGEISISERRAFPTRSELGPEQTLERLESTVRAILSDRGLSTKEVTRIGISCGGPLDSRNGVILGPPNLPGWDEVRITERFQSRLGIPCSLQNDANACALAEWKWGAGMGSRNMVFLTFGTGLGAGLILDGKLYTGTNDLAGEVGHVRLAEDGPLGYGKRGSFEGFCSGGGIARLARDICRERILRGEKVRFCETIETADQLTAELVGRAAASGDPVALEVFRTVGRYLGLGLSMLIDVLNPEVIVIGSVFARQRDLLWPPAEEVIRREALPLSSAVCRVVPAALGEAIGDYACLSVASE